MNNFDYISRAVRRPQTMYHLSTPQQMIQKHLHPQHQQQQQQISQQTVRYLKIVYFSFLYHLLDIISKLHLFHSQSHQSFSSMFHMQYVNQNQSNPIQQGHQQLSQPQVQEQPSSKLQSIHRIETRQTQR